MAEIESRIGQDAEGLQAQIEEQRQMIARLRGELAAAAKDVTQQAAAELEQHAAERRRALQDVAERLQQARARLAGDRRARGQRRGAADPARVRRHRAPTGRPDAATRHVARRRATRRLHRNSSTRRSATAREGAARRLSRELDLAVERFAREAEGVLAERSEPRQRQRGEARRGPALAAAVRPRAPARRGAHVTRGAGASGRGCAS